MRIVQQSSPTQPSDRRRREDLLIQAAFWVVAALVAVIAWFAYQTPSFR